MSDAKRLGVTVAVNDGSFDDLVLGSTTPVLVDFWTDWCGPCKRIAPVLDGIAAEKSSSLTVAKIDVEANPATAKRFNVVSIPTMILFDKGEPVKRIVGARSKVTLLKGLGDFA